MTTRRITVLGDGQMGLVCAALLADRNDTRVTLWGHAPSALESLAESRKSHRLAAFVLPDKVLVLPDESEALQGADLIVSAAPTQFVRSVWERVRPHVPSRAAIVSVAKGVENRTLLRPSQIILDTLAEEPSERPIAALSGPTIAAELVRRLPATMVVASHVAELASTVQELFTTPWLRIYTNDDLIGVEIAGATKNVIAIAAGVVDGLQAGCNAKSALLARGLAEIARLGVALGARPETFFGVAGVGDLATSCFSPEGRNRSCGEALGRGETLEDYLASSSYVVEGVATTRSVMDLARREHVDMPIAAAVHAVLFEHVDPIDAISGLMSRAPKPERVS